MTIGIAAFGPQAGLAVVRALTAVERVGRGAIGGFASFVALGADGTLWRAETQRGGTTTLFVAGEATGVPPPPAFAEAPWAGVMSSGPDRPPPLARFTPADPAIGLLTGHRLPNGEGSDGQPLNQAVLARMRAGEPPAAAVAAVLGAAPDADAGIIALDRQNRLVAVDSATVAERGDLGRCLLCRPGLGAGVAVLHNAIHPSGPLARLAAEVALDTMAPEDRSDLWITVAAGTPLVLGARNAVILGDGDHARTIVVTRPAMLTGRVSGAPVSYRAAVERHGRRLGFTTGEPYGLIEDGRIVSLSGQDEVQIGVRLVEK